MLCRSAYKLTRYVRNGFQKEPSRKVNESRKVVSIPHAHKIAHNLKNVGSRYALQVVFSAPNKLGKICARLDGKGSTNVKGNRYRCTIKHTKEFVKCRSSVVYCLPISCGKVYIG